MAEWYVDEAKRRGMMPGDSVYVPHPGCTSSAKCWLYLNADGTGFYCNKCGASGFVYHGLRTLGEWKKIRAKELEVAEETSPRLPSDYSLDIPEHAACWLLAAGINSEEAESHCIGWSPGLERVILPIYNGRQLLYYQARSVDGRLPKYINPRVSKERVLCGLDQLDVKRPVCVCEDYLSCVRVSNIMQCTSPLGTKLSEWQEQYLGQFPCVYLWLDPDMAGRRGRAKMRKSLLWNTRVVLVDSEKDPKCYPDRGIKEILQGAKNMSHMQISK